MPACARELWSATAPAARGAALRAAHGEMYEGTPQEKALITMWMSFSATATDAAALDGALANNSYLVAERMTLADVSVYFALGAAIAENPTAHTYRWLAQVHSQLGASALPLTLSPPRNVDGPVRAPATTAVAPKMKDKKAEKAAKAKAKAKEGGDVAKPAAAVGSAGAASSPVDDARAAIVAMDVRVGIILECWPHPDAEKLFCEKIDVGEETPRTIASGLRAKYTAEDLVGRKVLVFANLKARTMQGFKSEGMVICACSPDHETIKFVEVPEGAVPGDRVSFGDLVNAAPASASNVVKKKLLEKVLPFLKTDSTGVATCAGAAFVIPGKGQCTAPLFDVSIS
ncbi:hypothetical protein M885DRAFT_513586 [Pelagophyceae sp. CCMP2097]|nr:hypothetical protein M885DRAFT_513586 [Pelagophyceae sp. CCMP2097]